MKVGTLVGTATREVIRESSTSMSDKSPRDNSAEASKAGNGRPTRVPTCPDKSPHASCGSSAGHSHKALGVSGE